MRTSFGKELGLLKRRDFTPIRYRFLHKPCNAEIVRYSLKFDDFLKIKHEMSSKTSGIEREMWANATSIWRCSKCGKLYPGDSFDFARYGLYLSEVYCFFPDVIVEKIES